MTNNTWPEKAKIRLTGSYWQEHREGRNTETVYDATLYYEYEDGTAAYEFTDGTEGDIVSCAWIGPNPMDLAAEIVTGPEAHPAGRDL